MTKLWKVIKSYLPKTQSTPSTHHGIVDIYGREIHNGLEFFYPKKIVGIPVFSTESIYNHYREKIEQIRLASGIGEHRKHGDRTHLDLLFTDVILRYIEFIHMLPASENHHHSTPGGLIVHSLDASIHTQLYAKEHKPESTGMSDIDRKSLPKYRYAAWLASLLHDAGKVLKDIVVHAVEIEHKGENVPVTSDNPIPIWRPQKETLIAWAKRNHVATYSITYLKNRVHNQHNVDSIQVLQPVLGRHFALDYLLESPTDIHSQLVRLLAGHMNGKDYLSTSVRRGDTLSTSQNMALSAENTFLTEQSLSTSAKIYKALKIARADWTYNEANSEAFVIGGEVYLRYTKAFHSIIKTALANDLSIPNKLETVTMVMEDAGIIESFDEEHRSIKFSPGEFTDKQLERIQTGKDVITWSTLIRVKWKGLIFGEEAMPDSLCGIFYASENDTLFEVNSYGEVKAHQPTNKPSPNQTTQPATTQPTDSARNQNPSLSGTDKQQTSPSSNVVPITGPKKQVPDTATTTKAKSPPKIVFKNDPNSQTDSSQEQDTPSSETQDVKDKESPSTQPKKQKKVRAKKGKSISSSDSDSNSGTDNKSVDMPMSTTESVTEQQAHPQQTLSLDENTEPETSSTPSINIPSSLDPVLLENHEGHYIDLDDVMAYYQTEDKPAAVKRIVADGFALTVKGKPNIVLHKEGKKSFQMIQVIEPSSQHIISSLNESETTPEAPVHIDTSKQESLNKTESKSEETAAPDADTDSITDQSEDSLGLRFIFKNATPGTLAFLLSSLLEKKQDDFFGVVLIQEAETVSINISELVDHINSTHPDSSYQYRHLTKQCRTAGIEYKKLQRNKLNYIALSPTSLDKISIEV